MAPITCQVLNSSQEPIAGMRVTLACPEFPILFQAFTSYSGLINRWMAFTAPPQHGPVVVDAGKFSLCRLTFDLAERLDDPLTWPTVQVEMNLQRQHVVVLPCDSLGYRIGTTIVPPCPPRVPGFLMSGSPFQDVGDYDRFPYGHCPTGAERGPRRTTGRPALLGTLRSPIPSPMEDVQFTHRPLHRGRACNQQSGKTWEDASAEEGENPHSTQQRGRGRRRRRHRDGAKRGRARRRAEGQA